jgi:predicted MPP superfamily phosphohydrolase
MTLFLLTFFLIYGSVHLYAFLKAKAAFAFGIHTGIYIALVMVLMIFAPIIVRLSEKAGFEFFARLMSYIGYTWMGILFLFFSASLIIDIYHLLIYLSSLILRKDFILLTPSARFSFFIPFLLSVVIGIYGYFEAKNIRTETVIIKSPKIPEEIGRLRIVQISDVHLGLIVGEERLKRILNEVKKANPDILVSTGDLVDGQIDNLSEFAESFKEINPRYGKFAITGNHEFYAGLTNALNFIKKAGFTILRGEGLTVAGLINIAGVDDPGGKTYGNFKDIPEKELLSELHSGKFTLLLKHRPLVDKNAIGLFDLQLSGHIHKGQIFPFSLITGLYYPTQAGFANLPNGSCLYVSRGAGTWGPPIRFLSPPAVTIIELVHKSIDSNKN